MKLRRYLDKKQPENSVCLMSIMNINFNTLRHIEENESRDNSNKIRHSNNDKSVKPGNSRIYSKYGMNVNSQENLSSGKNNHKYRYISKGRVTEYSSINYHNHNGNDNLRKTSNINSIIILNNSQPSNNDGSKNMSNYNTKINRNNKQIKFPQIVSQQFKDIKDNNDSNYYQFMNTENNSNNIKITRHSNIEETLNKNSQLINKLSSYSPLSNNQESVANVKNKLRILYELHNSYSKIPEKEVYNSISKVINGNNLKPPYKEIMFNSHSNSNVNSIKKIKPNNKYNEEIKNAPSNTNISISNAKIKQILEMPNIIKGNNPSSNKKIISEQMNKSTLYNNEYIRNIIKSSSIDKNTKSLPSSNNKKLTFTNHTSTYTFQSNANKSINSLSTTNSLKSINKLSKQKLLKDNNLLRSEETNKDLFNRRNNGNSSKNNNKNDIQNTNNLKSNKNGTNNNKLNKIKENNADIDSSSSSEEENNEEENKHIIFNNKINSIITNLEFNKETSNNNNNLNKDGKLFYYCIKSKKESPLFIHIMQHRLNWQIISYTNIKKGAKYNFLWKYSNKKVPFRSFNKAFNNGVAKVENIRIFSHLEFHYEMTNKKNLFFNLLEYCSDNNLDPFRYIPFTVILNNKKKDYNFNIASFKLLFDNLPVSDNFNINSKNSNNNYIKNHAINDSLLGEQYAKYFTHTDKIRLLNNVRIRIPSSYDTGKNYWILKPDNLCQGALINLFDSFEELIKETKKYFTGINKYKNTITMQNNQNNNNNESLINETAVIPNNQNNQTIIKENSKKKKSKLYISSSLLIQKYIEKPLLFKGRKFDIRVFLLIDHKMNLYIFKEGHLKTSSEKYNIETKETYVHITNYSLQKYNPNFAMHEIGNELSFRVFQDYLDSIDSGVSVYKDIMPKIKELILVSVKSVANKINRRNVHYTFEIYGCDLILDENYHPYLFEINDNPGLTFSSPIIEEIVPRILDDAFRYTLDVIYPTKLENLVNINGKEKYKSRFPVAGYSDEENMFEYMCCLRE